MRTISSPLTLLALTAVPAATDSKAILGIDLGSLYMKVALVQRNSPLEIVTNMHSKRRTEQMVLFDAGSRFYGADASSLMARKPHLTPSAMSVMLGRDADHPSIRALSERHAFVPQYNATRSGVCLTVDGREFTPEELVAMVLTHARDITAAYGVTVPLKDCVLTVPSFYTQHERRALLDAAALADLRVLALINENTAAALHFGIDRIDEAPLTYLFYNMGAGSLQVSVVRYLSYPHKATKYAKEKRAGGFEVLASSWDATLGGASFDARLVEHMADEFNGFWNTARGTEGRDVRDFPRAMAKLRIQANKVKHVLSANSDIPIFLDALHDDVNYHTNINRATFEEICHDLLLRAAAPIDQVLALANVTLDQLDAVEMIGGAMRVPKVQEAMQHVLGEGLTLGMHLNSDESMALGAAFHGANVSTSFKVRHVGMVDVNSFPVAVDLIQLPEKPEGGGGLFGIGKKKADDAMKDDGDAWAKRATVFKLGAKLGVKKTIAFSYDRDVHVELSYEGGPTLPKGTGLSIEKYNVSGVSEFAKEMAEKDLGTPKVSLQFEMDMSGLTQLIKAEAAVEEIVMVEEEVEVVEEEEEEGEEKKTEEAVAEEAAAEAGEENKLDEMTEEEGEKKEEGEEASVAEDKMEEEGEKKEEGEETAAAEKMNEAKNDMKEDGEATGDKKVEVDDKKEGEKKEKEEKKKKTKIVQKEKKKKHVRTLQVSSYHAGSIRPHTPAIMAESKAKLDLLDKIDGERIKLEETKNKFESYIYFIRNRLIDDEDVIGEVTTEEQRTALSKSAEDAEEWMFDDGYTADLEMYKAKYDELSAPATKVFFRAAELTARPKAVEALNAKLTKIEDLMTKWETTMTHVTEEDRTEVLDKVKDVHAWIEEKTSLQEATAATEEPVFTSQEVPGQTKRIESIVGRLLKKKKPKPPKTNETEAEEKIAADVEEKNAMDTATEGSETKEEGKATEESSESTEPPEEGETKEKNGAGGKEETKSETPAGEENIKPDGEEDEL